jgi:hypothetical protein
MGIASPGVNRAGLVRRLPPNGLRLANVYRGTDRDPVCRNPVFAATFGNAYFGVADRRKARGNRRLFMN